VRTTNRFEFSFLAACAVVIGSVGGLATRAVAEPPLEQYITLDDGLYALQADGTYSKVEGRRPQPQSRVHHDHHHHQGEAVPQSGGKYLRLDDGLYVLQSDGTYMRAEDMPRPQRPVPSGSGQGGNWVQGGNGQSWQGGQRIPQQQWQNNGWNNQNNGWNNQNNGWNNQNNGWNNQNNGWNQQSNGWNNQQQWQNNGRRPQQNGRQNWQNNQNAAQNAAAIGAFIQGLSNAANQSRPRPPRPAPVNVVPQQQFVNPAPVPQQVTPAAPVINQSPVVNNRLNEKVDAPGSFNLGAPAP